MFSKKLHADVKKSTLKLQDVKKDSATRFKHLRIILEHVDSEEAKTLFDHNYSHIYFIFYDNFINAESNLRQKVHKAHREELEAVLSILDKLLTVIPELISRRWQCHSLTRIITKLLHPGNSYKLRKEAIRYFLLWYQILSDNSPDEVHALFATLVPGFCSPFPEHPGLSELALSSAAAVFHDTQHGPICAIELLPVYPPQSGEKQPEDQIRFFIDALLEYMVSQISRIEWKDKSLKQQQCFTFLFERFKQYYLPHIFPEFSHETDLYKPNLKIPTLRSKSSVDGCRDVELFISCRVAVIKWVANFTHLTKSHPVSQLGRSVSVTPSESEGERSPGSELRRVSVGQASGSSYDTTIMSLFSSAEVYPSEDPNVPAFQIVRDVLYNNRENVNFIHEIYRQAFLLNFDHSPAIRRAISVYKDWIQMNVTELPPFMLEPLDVHHSSSSISSEFPNIENPDDLIHQNRLRNDSYLGAISKENLIVRAGMQNVLQVFITDASNVFLFDLGTNVPVLLDEQVDICKRVLNIYRYMVMHTHMDAKTWEQLLVVLLHVTSLILSPVPPKKKEETLGGRLAPAIFQTLIVTWIKANLNVVIPSDLWDQFLTVLSSLTQWEELIREWTKTLETLTRVLARHVYGLDLTDLPLDRLSEQKAKRQKKSVIGNKIERGDVGQQSESESKPSMSSTDCGVCIEKDVTTCPVLRRSASDSNVTWMKIHMSRQHSTSPANTPAILYSGVEIEVNHLVTRNNCTQQNSRLCRKYRSLDSFKVVKGYNSLYYDSEYATRSPSPAPSSGVESNSFKESPIQIDVLSNEGANVDTQDGKSVMSGGTVRGWLPDVASVLWLRMLGALGDINKIQDPILHSHVFHFLIELFETLAKIRLNQGIPGDNQLFSSQPELVPPLTIFSPWCFQALSLSESYQRGKLSAYRLLCNMTVMVHDVPLNSMHLSLFLSSLHKGLISSDQNIVNTLIKHCGPRFFSLQLPGFSVLLLDFVHAANSVLSSTEVRGGIPRTEAISILGALLSFPISITSLPVLYPSSADLMAMPYLDFRDHVLNIVLRSGKKEVAGVARCIALSSLGIFLYQELSRGRKHFKVKEAVNTLLLALRFNHKTVAQTATEILLLLCDHADILLQSYPEIPPRILEVLVGTLSHLMPVGDSDKRLLTSLVFCLGEWTMNIPIKKLTHKHNGTSLLSNVFKVLDDLCEGGKGQGVQVGSFHPDLVQEFNPNLSLDDLKQLDISSNKRTAFPPATVSPVHLNSTAHSIQLAAKLVIAHLVNNLGHFPLTNGGANLGSLVVEQDDVIGLPADQLSSQLFTAPNIQVFVTNQQQVVSLVEVPPLDVPGGGAADGLVSAPSQVRVIVRDLAGKFSWDASILYCTPEQNFKPGVDVEEEKCFEQDLGSSILNSLCVSSLPQHTLRHRAPHQLPTHVNSADDMDNLDDLLQFIGHTSPEVLESLDMPRNVPAPSFNSELEQEAMGSILGMRIMQQDYVEKNSFLSVGGFKRDIEEKPMASPFQYSRLLFSQFGLHGWDLRPQLYLVDKSDKLLRELRNLDSQRCRQTHKVAVIYVAEGQEDKNSILSNSGGSQAYEEFISGLAWEVELETHMGFMGGLQRNKMTGVTAPYYATSFTEAIFHVSTRMPSSNAEALLQKTRHLGNDEVHIVWSEHNRDYRRDIIPTEFCDILIVIYPLAHHLYRIQVSRKPDVPYFGPLFNEAVVGHKELPGLVRATALNASRAKRSMLPFFQQYYEERAWSLETILKNHKKATTFEEFAANVFSPVQTEPFQPCRSSGTSLQSVEEGSTSSAGSSTSATLVALLDVSSESSTNSQIPGDEESPSWFAVGMDCDVIPSHGISPRPLKKLCMKTGNRRNQPPSLTPPDSPTSRRSK